MATLDASDARNALPAGSHVSSITYDFNRIGGTAGTADHGFLTFHMTNGSIETLGGHPDARTESLGFYSHNDVTDARALTARFDVSVPPGMTAYSYAKSLVKAAANYNTHPLPYSPLGEEGYNSTSSTSSLLYHVGGKTALADLKRIAGDIGVSTRIATEDGVSRPNADLGGVAAIDYGAIRGREIATGLDHASIPADRFSAGPVKPVPSRGMEMTELYAEALEGQLIRLPVAAQQSMNESGVAVDRTLQYRPTTLQYERDGVLSETSNYQQRGKLLEVNEFTVVQDTGRGGRAVYSRSELERAAGNDIDALKAQLVPGRDVQFTFSSGKLGVETVQEQGLGRDSAQPVHALGGR